MNNRIKASISIFVLAFIVIAISVVFICFHEPKPKKAELSHVEIEDQIVFHTTNYLEPIFWIDSHHYLHVDNIDYKGIIDTGDTLFIRDSWEFEGSVTYTK